MPSRPTRAASGPLLAGSGGLHTVGDWLRLAITAFTRAPLVFAQGLPGPQEEAMFLIARFVGIETTDLPHFLNARLTRREIAQLTKLLRRRIDARVPTAYLVGAAPLGGLMFRVDSRVLIPRSYIVELLPEAIAQFAGPAWRPRRVLDLGTGSGCLAILAARHFPDAIIDAADLSAGALELAEENVHAHGLASRVHLLRSDLFSQLPPQHYDLILANPPYEPSSIVANLPPELRHEPREALDGGAEGMDHVRRIVADAPHFLGQNGVLVLELGGLRAELAAAFPDPSAHVFQLADGSDAVVGFRRKDLLLARPKRRAARRKPGRLEPGTDLAD